MYYAIYNEEANATRNEVLAITSTEAESLAVMADFSALYKNPRRLLVDTAAFVEFSNGGVVYIVSEIVDGEVVLRAA